MDEKLRKIIIASLLHDIGKFAQRTSIAKTEDVKRSINDDLKYPHAYFTNFVLKNIFNENDEVVRLASKHHNPVYWDEWIITEADRLSSGADRQEIEYESENVTSKNYNNYLTTPLKSIFDFISFDEKNNQTLNNCYHLKPLEPENIFPNNTNTLNENEYSNYWSNLKENFLNDLKNIEKNLDYDEYFISLDSLLERWFWCIPSATQEGGKDISLYDHSVTTSAIATIIYEFHKQDNTLEDIKKIKNREEKKFLFITGDISGIQKYIFDLKTTSYNAKMLRARSFEIQALCDILTFEILQRLNLPIFCRIMNSGGRFLLILPNTKNTKDILEEIRHDLDCYMIKRYYGELALCLSDGIEVSGNDLIQNNARKLFTNFAYDSAFAKMKKLQRGLKRIETYIIEEDYQKIKGAQNVCGLCMCRPIADGELCHVCSELIEVGGKIPKSNWIIYSKSDIENRSKLTLPFGWKIYIDVKESIEKRKNLIIYSVNKYKNGYGLAKIPYYLPTKLNGEVKEFNELVMINDDTENLTKIAMFKADLDNLGSIFSIGLGKNVSISRYATLSRMLHYFFSVYINYSLRSNKEFNDIYTVFSGGDDLCLIGRWDKIIEYALYIEEKFKNFVGSNPNLTISGGIALVSHNLPVKYIAEIAENNLEKSKSKEGKNCLTVFETTVKWDEAKKLIKNYGKNFDDWLKNEKVSSGQIYRLLKYNDMNRKLKEGKKIDRNILWHSLLRYEVARNIENENLKEKFLKIVNENIENIRIPACYAIYLNRDRKNK